MSCQKYLDRNVKNLLVCVVMHIFFLQLPPVRQQLQARPAAHQTVVASQTAKQILQSLKSYSTPLSVCYFSVYKCIVVSCLSLHIYIYVCECLAYAYMYMCVVGACVVIRCLLCVCVPY